jgi:hypothetical protein
MKGFRELTPTQQRAAITKTAGDLKRMRDLHPCQETSTTRRPPRPGCAGMEHVCFLLRLARDNAVS